MVNLGLIGFPLGHSFSKKYFTDKFRKEKIDGNYELFEIEHRSDIPKFLATHHELRGFNVTIPYKVKVIDYLDELSEEARSIGAINTVKIDRNERGATRYIGHNTDWIAFKESLVPLLNPDIKNALVLGTGGASKAIAYALKQLGIDTTFVSRTKPNSDDHIISYQDLSKEIIRNNPLIINCTPVGMSPDIDNAPDIPYKYIGRNHICYDLVYNPEVTRFMKLCSEQAAVVKNGLEMLHRQAEAAWQIWRDSKS